MDHETGEEKADQHRASEADDILIPLRGGDEGQEEHECEHDQGGVVRRVNHKSNEEKMGQHDGGRDFFLWIEFGVRAGPEGVEFLAEVKENRRVRDQDREDRFPAEMLEHEERVPVPCASNHHYRRRGEMRKGASDRDMDKQKADRRVAKRHRGLELEEFRDEQKRADRHGRRLSDEGSK